MRRLWAAAALLAGLLAASLANGWYTREVAGRITEQLALAQELAQQGEWDRAAERTRMAHADWENHQFYFHVVGRHGDIDGVWKGFRAVGEYLALREPDQYNAANAELMVQLELLAEMEQPSLANVL